MIFGQNIIDCLDGDVTQEEWDKTVDSFYKICLSVPELQGIVAMVQIIANVSKVAFPLVDGMLNSPDIVTDKPKLMAYRSKYIEPMDKEDLVKAEKTMKFFNDVAEKLAFDNSVKKIDPPVSDWNPSTFFEEYKQDIFFNKP